MLRSLALLLFAPLALAARPFELNDLDRLAEVAEPAISPDGAWIAYSVRTVNVEEDKPVYDLWRVSWDGRRREQLTFTDKSSEWQPEWSPDGRWLAFLSDRNDERERTQVWVMPRDGGEARRVAELPEGVQDFAWAPDSGRLVVVAIDRKSDHDDAKPAPPIVIDRYQFKADTEGLLTARRKHLYIVDVASGRPEQITSGQHDEQLPAWSPDGKWIAFTTKRGADPDRHMNSDVYVIEAKSGGAERQITTFDGIDQDPYWETRIAWSPDSKRIAYLQAGEQRWIEYAPPQLAIADIATGHTTIPANIDRAFSKVKWAPDGKSVYALIEQSRSTYLARIDARTGAVRYLMSGARFDIDLDVSKNGRVVLAGGDSQHPAELFAVEPKLRPLTQHNEWLSSVSLSTVEDIEFTSTDGTHIDGFLVKPAGYVPGKRYPAILRIHGGPVYQFSHEYMDEWQYYASQGFAVIAVNPRGSSGRGFEFAKAIYADWGNKDAKDVLAGVDYAVRSGVADPERLAVGGWSYGAILTNYVIAQDRRFKAAFSGAGMSNLLGMYGHDEYIHEYELELGKPWRAPEAYLKLSFPFLHADRIKTPTLFLCSQLDDNVPCIGAEQMYQALKSEDVPTELVIYPNQYHEIDIPSYRKDRFGRYVEWVKSHISAPSKEATSN